jgi:hypothetical protein
VRGEDHKWSDRFGLPFSDGDVRCAIMFHGELIVGGYFTQIGGVQANSVARWDGADWAPLEGGVDGLVEDLTIHDGHLIVAGFFRHAGELEIRNVARWDGVAWSALGAPGAAAVAHPGMTRLTTYRGDLVAAGYFDFDPGGYPSIARWVGSSWQPLGVGVHGAVTCMTTFRDDVYIGGSFSGVGAAPAMNIARWDGASWASPGGGILDERASGGVQTMVVFGDRLYVGGGFTRAGGTPASGLADWNGTEWTSTGGAGFLWVPLLAVHENRLLIGTDYGFHTWDGVSFGDNLGGLYGWVRAAASYGSEVLAFGSFVMWDPLELDRTRPATAVRWVDGAWKIVGHWSDRMHGLASEWGRGTVGALTTYRGQLVASGYIGHAGSVMGWRTADRIAAWDGEAWASLGPPRGSQGHDFYGYPAAMAVYQDTLDVCGDFYGYDESYGYGTYPVFRFDGSRWSTLRPLDIYPQALARVGGSLYIAGVSYSPADDARMLTIHRWAGDHWARIATAEDIGTNWPSVTVINYRGQLVAAGGFESLNGVTVHGPAIWNGLDWSPIGDFGGDCSPRYLERRLAVHNSRLVASGRYCSYSRSAVEAWDGLAWRPLGALHGQVTALASVRGVLYASGSLWIEPYRERATVASWNGTEWSLMGSGLDYPALAFAEFDNALFIGGPFTKAGGKPSFGIARWDGFLPKTPSRVPWLSHGRPNPFRSGTDLSLSLEVGGVVHAAVYDVRGREVALLSDGIRVAGTHSIRWDGRDRSGKQAPAGVYFVVAKSREGAVASRKVVRLQ